jgi:hypothetical protein
MLPTPDTSPITRQQASEKFRSLRNNKPSTLSGITETGTMLWIKPGRWENGHVQTLPKLVVPDHDFPVGDARQLCGSS